ncbi:hypothetical protein K443DRAFT_673602 [Laccaria amethystina LaAM-08-1]|uniref:Unplaced genomic scaffold K443scaffold_13, whole genome shotgun sequence n=1 Tax=Laccaria amethystina LaAM-08-1 TaxID=1095629 RepID=A0A0C9X592_9AGAR|nr:hypothetical protein K443DRAFT_673602 [Laccaria amethystina LaAM-08-1]
MRFFCGSLCQGRLVSVTRCQHRKLGDLAQKIEQNTGVSEPIPFRREPFIQPQKEPRQDPYLLVAPELTRLRSNLLDLLGSTQPGLTDIANYYFLQPSKQLRSLLVLLLSRATNGSGTHWDRKHWEALCEREFGHSERLDRPLTRPDVLHEWNPSMPDTTSSFESVFQLQRTSPRSDAPIPPSSSRSTTPCIVSPPILLPTQIRLAQIVEMIHIASTLHDGVVTEMDGKVDSAAAHGFANKLAILGGDFLLGRASTALSQLRESEVVELIASVISNLVEGEILSMGNVQTPELGAGAGPKTPAAAWDLYLKKTYLKTASLMAKGARAAVILGGCRESGILKEVAYAYGRNLGIAYQILEDTLDYEKGPSNVRLGLATGPALYAWEENPEIQPLIQRNFSNDGDVERAIDIVRGTSGIERTRILAQSYADRARKALHFLPDSDTKMALDTLTRIVIERTC